MQFDPISKFSDLIRLDQTEGTGVYIVSASSLTIFLLLTSGTVKNKSFNHGSALVVANQPPDFFSSPSGFEEHL